MTAPAPRDRVLNPHVDLTASNGKTISGSLEYFANGKTLVVIDDDGLETTQLSLTASEAPAEVAALASDQVLLRNWTALRGVPQALVEQGYVELGAEVRIGAFRLEAIVARVV